MATYGGLILTQTDSFDSGERYQCTGYRLVDGYVAVYEQSTNGRVNTGHDPGRVNTAPPLLLLPVTVNHTHVEDVEAAYKTDSLH